MKFEVVDTSSEKEIVTYVVKGISMLGFHQWKDIEQIDVRLDQLASEIGKLDSDDSETEQPSPIAVHIDFYLPDPLRDRMARRLAGLKNANDIPSNQDAPDLELVLPLRVSALLAAVVDEISHNHVPNAAFRVRISDDE